MSCTTPAPKNDSAETKWTITEPQLWCTVKPSYTIFFERLGLTLKIAEDEYGFEKLEALWRDMLAVPGVKEVIERYGGEVTIR